MDSDRMYPALIGDHVVVRIPVGFPALASDVAKQVLRNPAASELEAYSIVADYLENLIKDTTRKDDVIDLVTRLIKTDAERYIDGMMESGYTVEELDQLARVIQHGWKRHRTRAVKANDNDELLKSAESYGLSLKTANEAAILIQRAWREHRKSISDVERSDSKTGFWSKQSKTEFLDEVDYEGDSDETEHVNVVKKDQRGYVPPIPVIYDRHSLNNRSTINVLDEFQTFSIEEE